MEKEQRPAVEVVLTVLHAGGKFGEGGGYKVSGGLHGVGVSVVNALSERLDVEIRRDGYVWTQSYERGKPLGDLKKGEPTDGDRHDDHVPARRRRLRVARATTSPRSRSACATPRSSPRGLRIMLVDERGEGHQAEFHYEGGIVDFVKYLNRNKEPIHQQGDLVRGRERRGRGRGRDAVELLLPGVGVLVRQQHQHASRAARTCPASARR